MKNLLTDPFVPKYEQIKRIFRDEISKGKYRVGDQIPSENELPKIFSVSRHTILKAINDLVNERLLYREQGKGTFIARTERVSESDRLTTKSLALIMSFQKGTRSMFTEIIRGVEKVAADEKYDFIFCNSRGKSKLEAEHIQRLRKRVEGLIIFLSDDYQNYETTKEIILQLKKENFPFVLIDRYLEGIKTDYVVTDNFAGGYEATTHLIKLGHKRIGHILADDWRFQSALRERLEGYEKALSNHKLKNGLIQTVKRGSNCSQEIKSLLKKDSSTAIFTSEYWLALRIMEVINEEGIKIPEEMAIVGFDESLENSLEPLTTVIQPMEKIGEKATQLLIRKIKGETKETRQIKLKPHLVIRASTIGFKNKQRREK